MRDDRAEADTDATATIDGRLGFAVTEVAQMLGVSTDLVRTMIEDGRLHAVRMGRRWVVTAASVRTLLELDAPAAPPAFRADECGGVFDGVSVSSDADPGL